MIGVQPIRRARRALPWPAFLGALVVLVAGIVIAIYQEALFQQQRTREAQQEASILAASEAAALSFHDRAAAEEYVRSLQTNPEIEAAGVYTIAGERLAGFARSPGEPLPARFVPSLGPPLQGDRIAVTVPVIQQNTALGNVYLRTTAEPVSSRVLRGAVFALLIMTALVIIAGLGGAQSRLQRQAEHLEKTNTRLQSEMTERAKAEEALRQSQKMEAIGQLSGAIAHDFNNLLMVVRGNLRLLQRKLSLADNDRHIAAANEGIARAAALTQRVLAFSRKQDLSPDILQLSELVLGMDELIQSSLREGIELVRDLRSDWWVVLDRNQMENVLLNLVINARDAMPSGGKLFVSTSDSEIQTRSAEGGEVPRGSYVTLTIRDTGVGMSDEVRARALEPFFTTKPGGQGTGLGLSTTFGFVSQSGGYMIVESEPGRGTTVTILFPKASVATKTLNSERS